MYIIQMYGGDDLVEDEFYNLPIDKQNTILEKIFSIEDYSEYYEILKTEVNRKRLQNFIIKQTELLTVKPKPKRYKKVLIEDE